jgi:hypothetical protein
MKAVSTEGLPEPIAQAVAIMVETLRNQFLAKPQDRPRVDLPAWPGKVMGNVTREEIYENAR